MRSNPTSWVFPHKLLNLRTHAYQMHSIVSRAFISVFNVARNCNIFSHIKSQCTARLMRIVHAKSTAWKIVCKLYAIKATFSLLWSLCAIIFAFIHVHRKKNGFGHSGTKGLKQQQSKEVFETQMSLPIKLSRQGRKNKAMTTIAGTMTRGSKPNGNWANYAITKAPLSLSCVYKSQNNGNLSCCRKKIHEKKLSKTSHCLRNR